MNQGTGFLLIIVGLLMMYVVITGKFAIVEEAFIKLFNLQQANDNSQTLPKGTSVTIPIPTQSGTIALPEIFIPDYTKP